MKKMSMWLKALKWGPLAVSLLPAAVFAASANPGGPTTLGQLYQAVCNIANWFFAVVLVLAVIAFLYAAYMFLTGGGNEQKIAKARTAFFYGLVGTAIALLAQAFIFVIGNLLTAKIQTPC